MGKENSLCGQSGMEKMLSSPVDSRDDSILDGLDNGPQRICVRLQEPEHRFAVVFLSGPGDGLGPIGMV